MRLRTTSSLLTLLPLACLTAPLVANATTLGARMYDPTQGTTPLTSVAHSTALQVNAVNSFGQLRETLHYFVPNELAGVDYYYRHDVGTPWTGPFTAAHTFTDANGVSSPLLFGSLSAIRKSRNGGDFFEMAGVTQTGNLVFLHRSIDKAFLHGGPEWLSVKIKDDGNVQFRGKPAIAWVGDGNGDGHLEIAVLGVDKQTLAMSIYGFVCDDNWWPPTVNQMGNTVSRNFCGKLSSDWQLRYTISAPTDNHIALEQATPGGPSYLYEGENTNLYRRSRVSGSLTAWSARTQIKMGTDPQMGYGPFVRLADGRALLRRPNGGVWLYPATFATRTALFTTKTPVSIAAAGVSVVVQEANALFDGYVPSSGNTQIQTFAERVTVPEDALVPEDYGWKYTRQLGQLTTYDANNYSPNNLDDLHAWASGTCGAFEAFDELTKLPEPNTVAVFLGDLPMPDEAMGRGRDAWMTNTTATGASISPFQLPDMDFHMTSNVTCTGSSGDHPPAFDWDQCYCNQSDYDDCVNRVGIRYDEGTTNATHASDGNWNGNRVELGPFEVPTGGITLSAHEHRTFVFLTSGYMSADDDERLLLAIPDPDTGSFVPFYGPQGRYADAAEEEPIPEHNLYNVVAATSPNQLDMERMSLFHRVRSNRFNQVRTLRMGNDIYLFGAGGPKRESAIFLARVSIADIGNRDAWQYYRGTRNNVPVWGPDEGSALPIIRKYPDVTSFDASAPYVEGAPEACTQEISVVKHPYSGMLMMMYNCKLDDDHGYIFARTAEQPHGPWSKPQVIFTDEYRQSRSSVKRTDGWRISSHERLVRPDGSLNPRGDDGRGEIARPERPVDRNGTGFGPYMIPTWSILEDDNDAQTYRFVFNSWNPYKVHLFEAVFGSTSVLQGQPAPSGTLNPANAADLNLDFHICPGAALSGWTVTGNASIIKCVQQGAQLFIHQPQLGPPAIIRCPSTPCLSTAFDSAGNPAGSVVIEKQFLLGDWDYLSFDMLGGGGRVQLRVNDQTYRESFGRPLGTGGSLDPVLVKWDVRQFRGHLVTIRIVDPSNGQITGIHCPADATLPACSHPSFITLTAMNLSKAE